MQIQLSPFLSEGTGAISRLQLALAEAKQRLPECPPIFQLSEPPAFKLITMSGGQSSNPMYFNPYDMTPSYISSAL